MVTTICMVTVCQVQKEDAKNWLLSMIDTLPHDQLIRMCVTLWAIWHARRKVIYEDTFQSPLSTHFFVQSFISHLEQVKLSSIFEKKIMKPSTCDHPRWIPPPAGMVKINVDAGMTTTAPSSLVAPVARPETEVFLGSSAILFHVLFQKPLEAMEVHEGMNLAQDLALTCIKVATDRLSVLPCDEGAEPGEVCSHPTGNKELSSEFL
jgi:hypothetical protein